MKRLTIVLSDDGKVNGACVDDATREAFALTALTLPAELADLNAAAIEQASKTAATISAANAAKDKEVAAIKVENEAALQAASLALAAVNKEKSDLVADHEVKLAEEREKAKLGLEALEDTHAGIQKASSESAASQAAKLAALEASLREETATKQQAIVALIEHQRISDALAAQAEAAIVEGDQNALFKVLGEAKLFGKFREKVRMEEAVRAKRNELEAMEAKLEAFSTV